VASDYGGLVISRPCVVFVNFPTVTLAHSKEMEVWGYLWKTGVS
jgi:hypothetical protein